MTLDVIHADNGFRKAKPSPSRKRPNDQRPYQARTDSDCDTVDLIVRNAGAFERLFYDRNDLVEMFTRGYFRHDATKWLVDLDL